jgi:hypothetical protein
MRRRVAADIVAHRKVWHRVFWRAIAVLLVSGCALFLAAGSVGIVPALADDPPPPPAPVVAGPADGTGQPGVGSTDSTSGGTKSDSGSDPSPGSDSDDTNRSSSALLLWPTHGVTGTGFGATAIGFGACRQMTFTWEGGESTKVAALGGGAFAWFTVPAGADTGEHTVTASCGQANAPATFTVDAPPQKPTLTLSSVHGQPGIEVTATASGFGDCHPVSFQWDGTPLQGSTTTDGPAFTFTVPNDAPTNTHTVTASCGQANAPATFTVDAPPQKPTLALRPGHGTPGSQVTASGAGFACGNDRVQLRWDNDPPLTDASSGTFEVPLTVPAGVGGHSVTASCRDISERQPFTVTTEPTPVSGPPTALTLQPTSGLPADKVQVTGDRFSCASKSVELSWDDSTSLPNAPLDASGHFSASVPVPPTAVPGLITLRAACSDQPVLLAADYTLLAGPPPPPPQKIPWWLIVLTLGIAVLAVLAVRHWQKSKQGKPPTHTVRTVPRPDDQPKTTVSETPASGEATHTIYLETHSDPGTLTIREVDDVYSRSI